MVLWEISQNSRENICVGTSFLINLNYVDLQLHWKRRLAQVFSCEFGKIRKNTFFAEHHQTTASFAIPSVPFHPQSLFSGSLAIHLFQATISQTKQQKKPPSSPQMHHFPSLYLAPFKSSTKRFATLRQHTNGLLLSINFERFLETSNRLPTEKMTFSLLVYDLVTTLL